MQVAMKWINLMLYFLILMGVCHSLMNTLDTSRQKRYLIYPPNGGLIKIVLGFSAPIILSNKRSLNLAYNIQGQFRLPNQVIWWTNKFEGLSRMSKRQYPEMHEKEDESRKLVYFMLERFKNWNGKNGRECVLRTICEVSQSPMAPYNGMFGEIIDSVFIPGTSKVDQEFHDAQLAGINGINCLDLYKNCPLGDGFLDYFIFY